MIIAVDFDGTCVTHMYPKVGKETGATLVLKKLTEQGHQLILYTMRSGKELQDAVEWFKERDLPLWGVNQNPEQKKWTSSPKVYAELYIDDAALGAPFKFDPESGRGYVDWERVHSFLRLRGIII